MSSITFLDSTDRVISVDLGERHLAVPLNVLVWHEIVNLDTREDSLAITLCPLTGSSMSFHRGAAGNAEFGVSGLLFKENLVMYDRREKESLWPQMMRRAGRGSAKGTKLRMHPSVVMRWSGFRALHPDGIAVSRPGQYDRDYTRYPYDDPAKTGTAKVTESLYPEFAQTEDPPAMKERVLGVPNGYSGGTAFPYSDLQHPRGRRVVSFRQNGTEMIVLWNGTYQAAMAYEPKLGGESVRLKATDSSFVDRETQSEWTVEGRAVEGPLAGRQLEPVETAYVAFWFAWESFQPNTVLWKPDA